MLNRIYTFYMMHSLSIDETFDLIGHFKFEQKIYFIVLGVIQIFIAHHMVLNIFVGLEAPFTCTPKIGNHSILVNACPDNSPKNCYFHYNSSYKSVQEEWNLVCQDKYKLPLIQSVFMAGVMIGALLLGGLADRIGRLKTLIISLIFTIGFEALSSFAWSYELYIGLRFFGGVFCSLIILAGFVLSQELVGSSRRSLIGVCGGIFFSVGIALLSMISWSMNDWRTLSLITSTSGVVLLLIPCFLPESPRWLLSQHREEEARYIMEGIAKKNGTYHQLPNNWELAKLSKVKDRQGARMLLSHIYVSKITLILIFSWFVNSAVYYALTIASGNIDFGSVYLSTTLNGLVEIPGAFLAFYVIDKYGRLATVCGFMIICGSICISIIVFALVAPKSVLFLSLLAKLCISSSFSGIYIHSGEIFPTVIRNTGMSVVSVAARFGGIVSPFVLMLADVLPNLQFLMLGIFAVIAGILNLLLPETLNQPMPETIQDVVALSKSNIKTQTKGYMVLSKDEEEEVLHYLKNEDNV